MAYESYYTNKIIKTTKAQYDALKNGESVKGYKLNEKDTFVLDIDSLYNDLANKTETNNGINKSLYNLGYYDTITENSDGTYTITRQTGYLVLDGVKNKFNSKMNNTYNAEYMYTGVIPYIYKPTNISINPDIISDDFVTMSADGLYATNTRGISLDSSGIIIVGFTTSVSTLEDANAYLVQNPISIQYKLATSYTEKVEKNHYARYNERFILEHNKSEAERSANLFDVNNVEYGSIHEDGTNLWNGTARARSFYIPVLANTYYSISTNNSELLIYELYQYDSNKSHIEPYTSILNNTFTFLTRNNTYYIRILFRNTSNTDFNLDILSSVMLNEGSTPLPYQPYEGKVVHEKDLDSYTKKTIMLPDNTSLDTVTESGFYRLNMNPNFPHAQMIVCRGADTIAQMAFPYADTTMYVRTGNPFNTSGGLWHDWKQVAFTDHTHTSINTAFIFNNNDMPEAEGSAISANLAGTTTAHKLTFYRNGLSIPYQMDDSNDGGILRCRGNSESNTIFELATWDDYGTGETIQFNYYPTTSQVTPTYSVSVPKKTGTIALTSDIPGTASSSALGLVKSSTTGTAANRDYKVQVNDDGTMKVNVPWTDNNTTYSAGTGLSLNSSNNTFSVKTGYTTDANNRNYKVAADSNGNLYVNVPWSSSGTLDDSLSSTSTNALQNKAIYSVIAQSLLSFDSSRLLGGSNGSWKIKRYSNNTFLDIRYGQFSITGQEKTYNVSFGTGKSMTSSYYCVVCGIASGESRWFWTPIVQSRSTSRFKIYLRGNSGNDSSGTLTYIAIHSNVY